MDLDIYEALVRRSLEHGVPHSIVAAVFELPPDVTKEMQHEVRVAQFGTADQGEYLDHIQWLTLKRTAQTIEHGTPAEAARVASAVLGRQIAAAGKRPSEGMTDARRELMEAFAAMREGPGELAPAGRFVMGGAKEDDGYDDGDE